jgi:hypothetical protein
MGILGNRGHHEFEFTLAEWRQVVGMIPRATVLEVVRLKVREVVRLRSSRGCSILLTVAFAASLTVDECNAACVYVRVEADVRVCVRSPS